MVERQQAGTKVWRGQSFDDRVLDRRAALLRAGFELLGDEGVGGVTMRAVCRSAELSPRYFYESFTNTDELIVAVYDECNAELAAAIASAGVRPDTEATIAAAVEGAAGFFGADVRRVRVLLREPLTSPLLTERRSVILPDFLAAIATALGVEFAPDRSDRALAGSALAGALVSLVLDWTDGRFEAVQSEVTTYATNLIVTMLNR